VRKLKFILNLWAVKLKYWGNFFKGKGKNTERLRRKNKSWLSDPSHEIEESWKGQTDKTRYIGFQAERNDLAIYLDEQAHQIEFEHEKYVIASTARVK
jgi:hypothetical protein